MYKEIKIKWHEWKAYKSKFKDTNQFLYFILDSVETLLIALFFALIIRQFIIQTSLIPSGSMIPTMKVNDRLFVNKFIYRFTSPKNGDIVVFKSPTGDGKDYVKRCIGVPGDTISIKKGFVFVNNKPLILSGVLIQRDYTASETVKVPPNSYYVLGDNRAFSSDSRVWGFVPEKNLLGKALFTFWPLDRMKVLR